MLALYNAFKGRLDHGYVFAGANAWRAEKIESIKPLMATLVDEYNNIAQRFKGR